MATKNTGHWSRPKGATPFHSLPKRMTIGRRDSCDICLKHSNVSSRHSELSFQGGFWQVRDLGSQNGTKINGGSRITPMEWKAIPPGDEVSFATIVSY